MRSPEGNLPDQQLVEATPFRERLSDEQLGSLLAAVGNRESKALTLIAMTNGNTYTDDSLTARMHAIQGDIKGWAMAKGTSYNYCRLTFAPIGLVATEVTDAAHNRYGYVITDYGLDEGVTLAGLVTRLSEKHEAVGLNHLFGGTNSPSEIIEEQDGEYRKRAPLTRIKIFRELITHPKLPIRLTDLANALGVNLESMKAHLNQLRRFGIVTYKSFDIEGGYTFYNLSDEIPPGEPVAFRKYRSLTEFTYRYVIEHPNDEVTAQAVAGQYIASHSDMAEQSKKYVQNIISGALLSLSRQGFLAKKGYTQEQRSEVTLTDQQRYLLHEVIDMIDKFQYGDTKTWSEGKTYALNLLANPNRISALLKKAYDLSSQTNQIETSVLASFISTVLEVHPDSTVPEIQRLLEEEHGISLSRGSIAQAVRRATRNLILVRERVGRSDRYRNKPQDDLN